MSDTSEVQVEAVSNPSAAEVKPLTARETAQNMLSNFDQQYAQTQANIGQLNEQKAAIERQIADETFKLHQLRGASAGVQEVLKVLPE